MARPYRPVLLRNFKQRQQKVQNPITPGSGPLQEKNGNGFPPTSPAKAAPTTILRIEFKGLVTSTSTMQPVQCPSQSQQPIDDFRRRPVQVQFCIKSGDSIADCVDEVLHYGSEPGTLVIVNGSADDRGELILEKPFEIDSSKLMGIEKIRGGEGNISHKYSIARPITIEIRVAAVEHGALQYMLECCVNDRAPHVDGYLLAKVVSQLRTKHVSVPLQYVVGEGGGSIKEERSTGLNLVLSTTWFTTSRSPMEIYKASRQPKAAAPAPVERVEYVIDMAKPSTMIRRDLECQLCNRKRFIHCDDLETHLVQAHSTFSIKREDSLNSKGLVLRFHISANKSQQESGGSSESTSSPAHSDSQSPYNLRPGRQNWIVGKGWRYTEDECDEPSPRKRRKLASDLVVPKHADRQAAGETTHATDGDVDSGTENPELAKATQKHKPSRLRGDGSERRMPSPKATVPITPTRRESSNVKEIEAFDRSKQSATRTRGPNGRWLTESPRSSSREDTTLNTGSAANSAIKDKERGSKARRMRNSTQILSRDAEKVDSSSEPAEILKSPHKIPAGSPKLPSPPQRTPAEADSQPQSSISSVQPAAKAKSPQNSAPLTTAPLKAATTMSPEKVKKKLSDTSPEITTSKASTAAANSGASPIKTRLPTTSKDKALEPPNPSRSTFYPLLKPSELTDLVKSAGKISISTRAKLPIPSAPKGVQLFRTATRRPFSPGELASESEDEIDESWVVRRHEETINAHDDLTTIEKTFMKAWDAHFIKEQLSGNRHVPAAVVRFIHSNGRLLRIKELALECKLKLASLFRVGVITGMDMERCVALLEHTEKKKIKGRGTVNDAQDTATGTTEQERKAWKAGCLCGKAVGVTDMARALSCANSSCHNPEYHLACVGLAERPQTWYCPPCVKEKT